MSALYRCPVCGKGYTSKADAELCHGARPDDPQGQAATVPRDPFRIEGPAVIAFSGGRTSGLMLYRIIAAHGGALPPDVVPVFCNTGKEHDRTLDFVRDCADQWGVAIRWVEYRDAPVPDDRWTEVDYASASRDGRPFDELISRKSYLPNPVTRFCMTEMKIKASMRFVRATLGFDGLHTRVIGLRADEPSRVARGRQRFESGKDGKDGEPSYPLYTAGVTKADVSAFWRAQPFRLELPFNPDGTTPLGNCDLCFLKSAGKVSSIIATEPSRAVWWARAEQRIARTPRPTHVDDDEAPPPQGADRATFRKDRQSYSAMLAQGVMFVDDEDIEDCECTA